MSSLEVEQKYYNNLISERVGNLNSNKLESSLIETALGRMIAIADSESLYMLEFIDRIKLPQQIRKLQRATKSSISHSGNNPIIALLTKELDSYHKGKLQEFKTPITLLGTEFQKEVWRKLQMIPFGLRISYMAHAMAIGAPKSYRATANAIGANNLAIVVPCHRVIQTSGDLGGYAGGVERKKALLDHERKSS